MRQLTTQLYQFRGLAQTASGNSEKKSQQMDPTVVIAEDASAFNSPRAVTC